MKYTVKELCDKKVAILTPTFESFKTIIKMLKRHGVGGLCLESDRIVKKAFNKYGKNTFVIVMRGFLPIMPKYCLVFGEKVEIQDDYIIDEGRDFVLCEDGIDTTTNIATTAIEDGVIHLEIEIKNGQNLFDVISDWVEKNRKKKESAVGQFGIFSDIEEFLNLEDAKKGRATIQFLHKIEDGKYIAARGAWKFFRPLTSEEKALL